MGETMVMHDSPEAAQFRTDIEGWVARDGRFYGAGAGAEAAARYHGCTHEPCRQCGAAMKKNWSNKCDACRELADIAHYAAMPRAEWDGKAMLYSEETDRYYADPDEAADDLAADQTLADLRLVICEPNYARHLDPADYVDDMAEDGALPDELLEAIDAFNIGVAGTVLSWSPGKTALLINQPEELAT